MKKTFTLLLISLAIASFSAKAGSATFSWFLAGGGSTGADRAADVVTDASGNIFTAHYFLNTATFNAVSLTGSAKGSGANYDNSLFVSKISPSKTTLWTLSSNEGVVTPVAMATTPTGELYLTATIRAVAGGATTNANLIDATGAVYSFQGLSTATANVQSFVAKFNAAGALQWVQELGSGTAKDKGVTTTALTTDAAGNVYLAGTYVSTVVLPTAGNATTLTSENSTQAAFITRLNAADGVAAWYLHSSGKIVSEIFSGLSSGSDGMLYASGIFRNATTPVAVTIGSATFTPASGYSVTLIRFNTDGQISYITQRSNASDTRVKDMEVKDGKVFIGGSFRSGTDGSGIQLQNGSYISSTNTAYLNGYLMAFDAVTGNDLWYKTVVAPAIAEIYGLATGADNHLYAFGTHYNALGTAVASGSVDFGNGQTLADTGTSNKMGDLFLSSYNTTDGSTQEVHLVASGSGSETSNALAAAGDKLYLVGSGNSLPMTFENNATYSTSGSFDFFLASYAVAQPTGLTDASAPALTAYVDKNARQLVLNDAAAVRHIRLYDTSGRLIRSQQFATGQTTIKMNIADVDAGTYVLQALSANGLPSTQKLCIY